MDRAGIPGRPPLSIHLRANYPAAVQQVEAVRIRPVIGVDPSAWPMVSATGLPHGVPWHLVRAHALLRWSVLNPDHAALDSALRIIHESELLMLSEIARKFSLAGEVGRAAQRQIAAKNHERILSIFDRLRMERPGASVNDLVSRTATEAGCSEATVWRSLRRKKVLSMALLDSRS